MPRTARGFSRELFRARGVTLVELCIGIAVLAVLLAIGVPTVSRVRRQSQLIGCGNNIRQIFTSLGLYACDYNGALPNPGDISNTPTPQFADRAWTMRQTGVADFEVGSLLKYLGPDVQTRQKILLCPADQNEQPWVAGKTVHCQRNFSYSFNYGVRLPGGGIMQLTGVHEPSQRILLWEERAPNDGYCVCDSGDYDDYPSARHDGRGCQGFADGHMEVLPPQEVFDRDLYCVLSK